MEFTSTTGLTECSILMLPSANSAWKDGVEVQSISQSNENKDQHFLYLLKVLC